MVGATLEIPVQEGNSVQALIAFVHKSEALQ